MIVLFSESNIGVHSEYPIDCKIIPIVFIPTVKKVDEQYEPFVNLDNNEKINGIIGLENTYLIGFDLDENGEFMAQALRNYLLSKSISKRT